MPVTSERNRTGSRNESYRSYRAYDRERVYSNSSTAYDIPPLYPEPARRKTTQSSPKKTTSTHRKTTVQVSKKQVLKFAVAGLVIFVLCFAVLYRYGMILKKNQEMKNLESDLNGVLSVNQAIRSKIDKQMELSEIEKYAKSELGMMKPQPYQIFYIDMDMQDKSGGGSVSQNAESSVAGTPGTLMNAFKVLN